MKHFTKHIIIILLFISCPQICKPQRLDLLNDISIFDPINYVLTNLIYTNNLKIEKEIIKKAKVKSIFTNSEKFSFDEEGNLKEYDIFLDYGKSEPPFTQNNYVYDNLNRIKTIDVHTSVSNAWFDYMFYYDQDNRLFLIDEIFHNRDGKLIHSRAINFFYLNSFNKDILTDMKYLYSDDSGSELHFEYNSNGKIISFSKTIITDGKLSPSNEYDEYTSFNYEIDFIIEKIIRDSDTTKYKYNKDNRIIELSEHKKNEDLKVTKYFYNELNSLIDKVEKIKNKEVCNIKYKYEFYQ